MVWNPSKLLTVLGRIMGIVGSQESMKQPVIRLYLVRHGETEANIEQKVVGQWDSVSDGHDGRQERRMTEVSLFLTTVCSSKK